MSQNLVTILIVDDHALVRDVLLRQLAAHKDLDVIAAVGSADEAISAATTHHPRIILMDIDMPGLLPFTAAKQILTRCPSTRVAFLSGFCRDADIEQSLAIGASGYILKSEPLDRLIQAIRTIDSGGCAFSPEVQSRIVIDRRGLRLGQPQRTRLSALTNREREVLRYIARGLSQKEIAKTMQLSIKTISCHCASLMSRLGIHDRVDLARFAIREGIEKP